MEEITIKFKYNIGEVMDNGIIETRFYLEHININGDKCNNNYYTMKDGNTYNEVIVRYAKTDSI